MQDFSGGDLNLFTRHPEGQHYLGDVYLHVDTRSGSRDQQLPDSLSSSSCKI